MRHVVVIGLCVLLCGSMATESRADADIGLRGAGGRLSFVSPSDIDATIGFGAIVDLGMITPDIGLEATLDFWSRSEGSGTLEFTFRDIIFGARGKYNFEVSDEKLKPYAAAGLALHLFKVDIPTITFQDTTIGGGSDTSTKIGLDLAGGVGYAAGDSFDIVGEIMYRIVSDISQFVLSGGIVFWFGGE